jgi:tryptophan 2,3-dioxygenase
MHEPNPPPKPFVDLSDEQVHWDLRESLSYSQYLNLDKLLDAQHPLSYQHDEMLFIIIHQVSELWMKLCLHELNTTVDCVRRDDLGPTFKMLSRVSTIQRTTARRRQAHRAGGAGGPPGTLSLHQG